MKKTTLGLDLGPNSIGWAILEEDDEDPSQSRLVDMGVRVFTEGIENFAGNKEESRNEKRRKARLMRRQHHRRTRRKHNLKIALVAAGLWPSEASSETALYNQDPYDLRRRAVTEELTLHEFGRCLLHLSQRRGFKSNRKKDRGDEEAQGMLAEINQNEQERVAGGFATVGEWLADKHAALDHRDRSENDHVRGRHLQRSQFEEEFDLIWETQSLFHPDLLTETLKYGSQGRQDYPVKPRPAPEGESLLGAFGIHGLVFFQRPVYWPRSVIGLCELEPKEKRCPTADRRYQRFRLLQNVNNLRYIDPLNHKKTTLTMDQRHTVIEALSKTKDMSFDSIRTKLGFPENVRFNLEADKKPKMVGVPIDALYAAKAVAGKAWYEISEEKRDSIVAASLDHHLDDNQTVDYLVSQLGLGADIAEKIIDVPLPSGYGHLSLKALKKLLPHMEGGLVYMADDEENSALHAAGYLRRDQLQRRLFDKLPNPAQSYECKIGNIPNPVVKRTLTEVRKVVNAIVREYGRPDAIHVEMARSLRQSKKDREKYFKQTTQKSRDREKVVEKLREYGISPRRENVIKYELWEQQKGECIYSGTPIIFERLFGDGGGVEVDHILPRSRTLDDSQANKVVCLRSENQDKGDQTPYEWLSTKDNDRYEQLMQRAGSLRQAGRFSFSKYERFIQRELELDDFIARQLNDTAYITRVTLEYLKCLFERDHDVLGLKGQLTAELRWQWGLDTILSEIPDSPAWAANADLRPGEKNRADHRHHAIDAVVIAATNRKRLQQLSRIVKTGGARSHGEVLLEPWLTFRRDVAQRVADVNVSHRVERKASGALHQESLYGPTNDDRQWVKRTPVTDLTGDMIARVRDEAIRNTIMAQLKAHGVEFGRGKTPDRKKMKEALSNLTMDSGVPINNVRITKKDQTIQPLRDDEKNQAYVKPGSNHHLCIFEYEVKGKTKRDAVFVTMLEAINRIKAQQQAFAKDKAKLIAEGIRGKELRSGLDKLESRLAREMPLISRVHPDREDARFIMSLSRREMVLANIKGRERLLVFRTAPATQAQLRFTEHTDARKSNDARLLTATPNTLDGKKVTVDLLGRIHWAND